MAGADYTKLNNLLAAGDFKAADLETWEKMLWVAKQEKEGWLYTSDIEKFPCKDLRSINRLWLHHSGGKYGFSVQKQIWIDVRGRPGDYNPEEYNKDAYIRFAERVGWKVKRVGIEWKSYDELTWDLRGERGHLPTAKNVRHSVDATLYNYGEHISSIALRSVNCGL